MPGSGAFILGCCHRSWSLRLQMPPPRLKKAVGEGWVSGTASIPYPPFSGVKVVPGVSGHWLCCCSSIPLLHEVQYTHLQIHRYVWMSWASWCALQRILSWAIRCPTGYNLKGRDKGDNSMMKTSPLLFYLTQMLTMLWENSLFCSARRSFGDFFSSPVVCTLHVAEILH